MLNGSGVIYQYCPSSHTHTAAVCYTPVSPVRRNVTILTKNSRRISPVWRLAAGSFLVGISLVGLSIPLAPRVKLETTYYSRKAKEKVSLAINPQVPLPPSAPVIFNPLLTPEGAVITPVNKEFSLIVPKVGINAEVVPNVNPLKANEYTVALKKGVAHASTSYFPDQPGPVYLFSHSTNYEWFVDDLNAVFYHLKNLEQGDLVVLFYKGNRYTYKLTHKKVVSPKDISYLAPDSDERTLILQTCWPPGSIAQRLLLFAELIEETGEQV